MPGMFPSLRTGAIAQFPFVRELRYSSEVVRFLDGSEQTYRLAGSARRRWCIDLSLLDAPELASLRAFFEQQKGRWGTFAFVDPIDNQSCPNCSFEDDAFPEQQDREGAGSVSLVVYEHN